MAQDVLLQILTDERMGGSRRTISLSTAVATCTEMLRSSLILG